MNVKKKSLVLLLVVVLFISCKTSIMYAMDSDQEGLRVGEKRWQLTTKINLCKGVNDGEVSLDQPEELLRRWQPIHIVRSCEKMNDDGEFPELTKKTFDKELACGEKRQFAISDKKVLFTEQALFDSKILQRFFDNSVREGKNLDIRDRLQKECNKLESQSENNKSAQKDDGFCILLTTEELFILANTAENHKKPIIVDVDDCAGQRRGKIALRFLKFAFTSSRLLSSYKLLTLAQYIGVSFFVIATIIHAFGLRFSNVLPK